MSTRLETLPGSPAASREPLPGSRKVHVEGPCGVRVPFREIALHPTRGSRGQTEINPPFRVYDTSGPYTDPGVAIDLHLGLSELRRPWIMARGEYDVMPRLFVFASQDAEYDGIESLSLRAVPKAGMGYRLWESKAGLLQLEAGGAYNYEKYFGGEDDGYFAVAFGKLLEWKLPWLGAEFMWRTDYLPSVDDFTDDYLFLCIQRQHR